MTVLADVSVTVDFSPKCWIYWIAQTNMAPNGILTEEQKDIMELFALRVEYWDTPWYHFRRRLELNSKIQEKSYRNLEKYMPQVIESLFGNTNKK
jgi:hypothetical protein